ncbi:MAG: tetratricopeptide repeat protein [Anaerolineae bacterium]|nr:tetratricopeptide repeat protein [Anaerolineae bacterium]
MRGRLILGIVVVFVLLGGVGAAVYFSNRPSDVTVDQDLDAVQAKIDAGDFEAAKADLEALLVEGEENAEVYFKLGLASFNLGDYQVARDHFNMSLSLEPDRAAAVHHNLGVLAYQVGDMEAAMAEFQAALEADPDDADTHYQLGATYLVLAFPMGAIEPDAGRFQQAEDEFNRALAEEPDKPEALVGLANIYMLRNDMAQAISTLERVIEQSPQMREALFALGRAYAAVGDTVNAKSTLEQFLDADPPAVWAEQAQEILQSLGQ